MEGGDQHVQLQEAKEGERKGQREEEEKVGGDNDVVEN